jgi:hypothetical protein
MAEPALDELIGQLGPKLDELREQGRLRQRGGERIRTGGAGAKDKLTTADRVLATVLYLRKLGTRNLIAQLFEDSSVSFGHPGDRLGVSVLRSEPAKPSDRTRQTEDCRNGYGDLGAQVHRSQHLPLPYWSTALAALLRSRGMTMTCPVTLGTVEVETLRIF